MTSEDKLRDLKTRQSQAVGQRARAEVELETAQERRNRALAALKDDFGITGPDDIERVQSGLQQKLDDAVARVTSSLDSL